MAWGTRLARRGRSDPRLHATHDESAYVLLQGRAILSEPVADYPSLLLERWEQFEPWEGISPVWKWWQRVYATRVAITITVERAVVWPNLSCDGTPEVLGARLADVNPSSQRRPQNGTGPRIDHRRAARRAACPTCCSAGSAPTPSPLWFRFQLPERSRAELC